jgi:hypothetical protein
MSIDVINKRILIWMRILEQMSVKKHYSFTSRKIQSLLLNCKYTIGAFIFKQSSCSRKAFKLPGHNPIIRICLTFIGREYRLSRQHFRRRYRCCLSNRRTWFPFPTSGSFLSTTAAAADVAAFCQGQCDRQMRRACRRQRCKNSGGNNILSICITYYMLQKL